jgi:hypothetical protein
MATPNKSQLKKQVNTKIQVPQNQWVRQLKETLTREQNHLKNNFVKSSICCDEAGKPFYLLTTEETPSILSFKINWL